MPHVPQEAWSALSGTSKVKTSLINNYITAYSLPHAKDNRNSFDVLLAKGASFDRPITYFAGQSLCVGVLQALKDHSWNANDPTTFGGSVLA
jgi:hypothetical protein